MGGGSMTYDYELTLIGSSSVDEDEVGNQVPVQQDTTVLCGKKSITRSEFYNAAVNGLKPEVVFVMHTYEYAGQTKAKFDGATYNVMRTFEVNTEEIELTCEKAGA